MFIFLHASTKEIEIPLIKTTNQNNINFQENWIKKSGLINKINNLQSLKNTFAINKSQIEELKKQLPQDHNLIQLQENLESSDLNAKISSIALLTSGLTSISGLASGIIYYLAGEKKQQQVTPGFDIALGFVCISSGLAAAFFTYKNYKLQKVKAIHDTITSMEDKQNNIVNQQDNEFSIINNSINNQKDKLTRLFECISRNEDQDIIAIHKQNTDFYPISSQTHEILQEIKTEITNLTLQSNQNKKLLIN